jgi:hypothetical protein
MLSDPLSQSRLAEAGPPASRRCSIFLLSASHHDPKRIIRQWPLQRLRLVPQALPRSPLKVVHIPANANSGQESFYASCARFAAVLRIFCHESEFKTPFRGGSCGMVRAARLLLSGLLALRPFLLLGRVRTPGAEGNQLCRASRIF